MTFVRPEFVMLAPLVAVLLALALTGQWKRLQRLTRFYSSPALERLVPVSLSRFPAARLLFLVSAGFAVALAVAEPIFFISDDTDTVATLDVAVAVDVSLSMNASDIDPTRIERAQEVIARLTEELPSARILLVVFAGWPYTLVPPTDDPAVVRYFAQSLQADLLEARDQGTSLSATLLHAQEALDTRPRPGSKQAILVLSDGDVHEDEEDIMRAVSNISSGGVQVWSAGIGTGRGTELMSGNVPVIDAGGRPVLAVLNEELLRSVATAGGGRYEDVTEDGGLNTLLSELGTLSGEIAEEGTGSTQPSFWLTLLAIPLLFFESALDAGKSLRPRRREDLAL